MAFKIIRIPNVKVFNGREKEKSLELLRAAELVTQSVF